MIRRSVSQSVVTYAATMRHTHSYTYVCMHKCIFRYRFAFPPPPSLLTARVPSLRAAFLKAISQAERRRLLAACCALCYYNVVVVVRMYNTTNCTADGAAGVDSLNVLWLYTRSLRLYYLTCSHCCCLIFLLRFSFLDFVIADCLYFFQHCFNTFSSFLF